MEKNCGNCKMMAEEREHDPEICGIYCDEENNYALWMANSETLIQVIKELVEVVNQLFSINCRNCEVCVPGRENNCCALEVKSKALELAKLIKEE